MFLEMEYGALYIQQDPYPDYFTENYKPLFTLLILLILLNFFYFSISFSTTNIMGNFLF